MKRHKIIEVKMLNVDGENQYTPICSCGWEGEPSTLSTLQATADEHQDKTGAEALRLAFWSVSL